jgi:hypothetical protein
MNSTPHEALYNAIRTWPHCDVLIDRMAGFPLAEEILEQGATQRALKDEIFTRMPDESPLAVRLERKHFSLVEGLLDHALQEATDSNRHMRSVCAFLCTQWGLEQLQAHLSRHLDASVEQFGHVYLRYFDPRVASRFPDILDPKQYARWLRGIDAWFYVDWRGMLKQLPRPTVDATEILSSAALRPTYRLDQWDAMELIAPANLALKRLQRLGIAMENDMPNRIYHALQSAVRNGLVAQQDQVAFAVHVIAFNDEFLGHPDYIATLALAVDHGIPLNDAIEQRMNLNLRQPAL